MVFHFAQTKQKWKTYRDQDRLTFLAPLHQTPSVRFALRRSRVWLKGEPARRLRAGGLTFCCSVRIWFCRWTELWRRCGLMTSALVSGSSGPCSSPGRGPCTAFLDETLNSQRASLYPGVLMSTGELKLQSVPSQRARIVWAFPSEYIQ